MTEMNEMFKALMTTGHTATPLTNLTSNTVITLIRFDKVPSQFDGKHPAKLWYAVADNGCIFTIAATRAKALADLEEDYGLRFAESVD